MDEKQSNSFSFEATRAATVRKCNPLWKKLPPFGKADIETLFGSAQKVVLVSPISRWGLLAVG